LRYDKKETRSLIFLKKSMSGFLFEKAPAAKAAGAFFRLACENKRLLVEDIAEAQLDLPYIRQESVVLQWRAEQIAAKSLHAELRHTVSGQAGIRQRA
jgi:hypothetical protein